MATYTFTPTTSLPSTLLSHRSTTAKVGFTPVDMFVDAELIAPEESSEDEDGNETGKWRVVVDALPNSSMHPIAKATLYLTKGELGRSLGSVELGMARQRARKD